jgi:hypothetical protein
MALIEFKDYPNTETPINANNINNNFNELNEKNYITTRYTATSNFVLTKAATLFKYPLNDVILQEGNKLTFNAINSEVVVGEGVSIVEATFSSTVIFGTAGSILGYITKNDENQIATQTSSSDTATNQNVRGLSCSSIFNVEAGDKIALKFYTTNGTNNQIQRNFQTALAVKVLK